MVKLEVKYDLVTFFCFFFQYAVFHIHNKYKKHLMLDKMAQVVIKWKESLEIFFFLIFPFCNFHFEKLKDKSFIGDV